MGSSAIIWMGVNSFAGMYRGLVPTGCIGLGPYLATTPAVEYLKKFWLTADPKVYIDYDLDRTTFAGFTLFASDAVVALSIAYEHTIRAGTYNTVYT